MLDRFEAAVARRRVARRGVNMDARPQPAVEVGADCLPQIEHIVVLMMENHSYDNYLGMLAGRCDGLRPHSPPGSRSRPARATSSAWRR
jgi:phospholipase C